MRNSFATIGACIAFGLVPFADNIAGVVEPGNNIETRVSQLEEDGRGYNAGIVAITRCIRNAKGYAMRNGAMSHRMMSQCIDDWFDANADAYGVDH